MTVYQFSRFARLEPRTLQFKGGRIADTDVLTLDEAAKYASKHAGTEITPADFLRAAARGEITLRAIVHREAKLQKHNGGIYCNQGTPTENTAPKGAIPTLPLSACEHLASIGCASWRTFDGFEHRDGELMRFTEAMLIDSEPDFETVPGDCRVMGYDVHALADENIDTPASTSGATENAAPPAPGTCLPATDQQNGEMTATATAAKSGALAVGVPSAVIIDKFRLDDKWSEKLRKPDSYKYLLPALVQRGSRGLEQHRWNPAKLGEILIQKKERNLMAVSTVINRHFGTWSDEWDSIHG